MGAVNEAGDIRGNAQVVQWGVASRPLDPADVSGDIHVVASFPAGILVAVLDGLGHGGEAAAAAAAGATILRRHPEEPLVPLIQRCHDGLRHTRGVALALARIEACEGSLTWVGVGNVEAALFRAGGPHVARESLLTRGGVIGYQLPSLRPATLRLLRGDTLVLATDGLKSDFVSESPLGRDLQGYAEDLLRRFGRRTDDALVLAVRYLGPLR